MFAGWAVTQPHGSPAKAAGFVRSSLGSQLQLPGREYFFVRAMLRTELVMDKRQRGRLQAMMSPVSPVAAMLFLELQQENAPQAQPGCRGACLHSQAKMPRNPLAPIHPQAGSVISTLVRRLFQFRDRVRSTRRQSGRTHPRRGHCRGEGEDGRITRQRDTSSAPYPGRTRTALEGLTQGAKAADRELIINCTTTSSSQTWPKLNMAYRTHPKKFIISPLTV